jgi:transcriptional regulator with XRE-family HTH domain
MAKVVFMATRIGRHRPTRLFLDQWFEYRGLNDGKVAARIGLDRSTIWKWRSNQSRLDPDKIAALAVALDCKPEQLWQLPPRPDRPSVDALLQDAPDEVVRRAVEMVAILRRAG